MSSEKSPAMGEVNRDSTNRLQMENQRMEERLRMLRQMMSVEKAQREATSGDANGVTAVASGSHWASGKRGPLTVRKANSKKTEKLRLKKPLKVSVLTGQEVDPVIQEKVQCGQCDQYYASMACVECVENYCNMCFVKFHHKGSLSKHHVRPLTKAVVKECSTPSISSDENAVAGQQAQTSSLLVGDYDEAASAASFQEALNAWRNPSEKDNAQPAVSTAATISCGVQATSCIESPNAMEQFTDSSPVKSSSYFEQLLLKRLKTNPAFFTSIAPHHPGAVNQRTIDNEITDDTEPPQPVMMISPYNLFYSNSDGILETVMTQHDDSLSPSSQQTPSNTDANSVSIEELSTISTEQQILTVPDTIPITTTTTATATATVTKKTVSGRTRGASHHQVASKKVRKSKKSAPAANSQPITRHCVTDAALNASIEQLWRQCSNRTATSANGSDLSCLFLTSVLGNSSPNTTEPSLINDIDTVPTDSTLSTATVWIPANSNSTVVDNDISQFDLPPPSVPGSSLSHYYSSDDSESENDQVFLWEEEEVQPERDGEEDTSALEDLACELASLCVIDEESENISREGEEEEEEGEDQVWSCLTIEELVHDFDQFQDQIRQRDELSDKHHPM